MQFIGAGEKTVLRILGVFFPLQEKMKTSWPEPGIYDQVQVEKLIPKCVFEGLSEPHKKGTIDLVVITHKGYKFLVRVQGKGHGSGQKGLGKAKHDSVQKRFLEIKSKQIVVDVNLWECPQVFKERFNFVSIWEVSNALKTSGIKSEMVGENGPS